MKINDLMPADAAGAYYDHAFRNVLEDHLSFLRNHQSTTIITIDQQKAIKYNFDLIGLMSNSGIPTELHFVTMRMNGITSPQINTTGILYLYVPNGTVVEQIRQSYMTKIKQFT